jgi:hypothetical protein
MELLVKIEDVPNGYGLSNAHRNSMVMWDEIAIELSKSSLNLR